MRKPPAQTIFRWLRDNEMRLGGLTDHDASALLAAVQVAELWIRGDAENREKSAAAFGEVVGQMQPQMRYLAFHAIAHVGDWCHRWELWMAAGLLAQDLQNVPECAFGPKRKTPATEQEAAA